MGTLSTPEVPEVEQVPAETNQGAQEIKQEEEDGPFSENGTFSTFTGITRSLADFDQAVSIFKKQSRRK